MWNNISSKNQNCLSNSLYEKNRKLDFMWFKRDQLLNVIVDII